MSQKTQNFPEPMEFLHRHDLAGIQQKTALYLLNFNVSAVPNCKSRSRDICRAGSAQKDDLCPMQFPQRRQQLLTSLFYHKRTA